MEGLVVYYDIKKSKFRTIRGIDPEGFILSYPTDYYNDSITIFPEEVVPDNYLEDYLIEIGDKKSFPFCEEVNITTIDGTAKVDYKALPYSEEEIEETDEEIIELIDEPWCSFEVEDHWLSSWERDIDTKHYLRVASEESLEESLDKAVAEEDYEKAAIIRDEIIKKNKS